MIVMKFGGSSVATAERMSRVADLVMRSSEPVIVVVSAMGKTTDHLLLAASLAEQGAWEEAAEIVLRLRRDHEIASGPEISNALSELFEELTSILRGMYLLREQTPRSRALVSSFGERLSVEVLSWTIRQRGRSATAVDARNFIVTNDSYEEGVVDFEQSFLRANERLKPLLEDGVLPVVTGFIGATPSGATTTLGRGGSDYSAALVGSLLGAEEIWIWTDVEGILTADPRRVKEARSLSQVSYREAAEMSFFGAKVLHPKTMLPAMNQGIPIRIRSTFAPDHPGTVVGEASGETPFGVKTVTSMSDLALVTVDGRGMAGIPGFSRRIFSVTERADVNVVMISQASSEQTVSLAVPADHAVKLQGLLREEFSLELRAGILEGIRLRPDVAVLSIIGKGMSGNPGISGKLFSALGQTFVNVLAIAQGASELSISVAVDAADVTRGVRGVHTAFGLTRVAHVFLVGCGRVGQSLLQMLSETRARHADDLHVDLRLVGLCTSSKWLFDAEGLAASEAGARVREEGEERPSDTELVQALHAECFTEVILVDVTASETTALHELALRAGFHVVTANKIPLSGPLHRYQDLRRAWDSAGGSYRYETTFGAGLPVLHTLKELVNTGDTLQVVRGCFSGTLGFICTRLEEGLPLAGAVKEAEERGYTEPDPREDLSGRDVGRKALIIARAMGMDLQGADVQLEPLVPGLERGLDEAIAAHEEPLRDALAAAADRDEVLRYVASISSDGVEVGLRAVPRSSAIGSLRGPDNILVFQTSRYRDYPLVIRGPGAGADVTAAGVLGDILKVVL